MSIQQRNLSGSAFTSDSTPTPLCTLPALPADGSFTLSGSVTARDVSGGLTTTFLPMNSGSIVAGVVTQSAGSAEAAPCPTSPADGGTAQGFAPRGCSTSANGLGQTIALDVTGVVAALSVVGRSETLVEWTWDLDVVVVSP